MTTPPVGISEADWQATAAGIRALNWSQQQEIQVLRQENEQLRTQLTALATELANLRERIGRRPRHSSKPPSSDGPGHRCPENPSGCKPPERRKRIGRKRGGQLGDPGSGPELLPIERVDEVVEATGPGYLAVPRAGLDCPSPRWRDALIAAGSLSSSAQTTDQISLATRRGPGGNGAVDRPDL